MTRKIITTFLDVPGPLKECWQAHFEGDEPNDDGHMTVGYGTTPQEAEADLLDVAT